MSSDQEIATMTHPNPFAVLFQEIVEIAQAALRRSPYLELHDIRCDYSGGVLTLQGHVPTYHLKQLAQASVIDMPGVIEVHNRIEVSASRVFQNPATGWREQESLVSAESG